MLKITYTDTAPQLEYLTQTVEDWVAHYTVLVLRTGQSLLIAPGKASVLLPLGFGDRVQLILGGVTPPHQYQAIALPFAAVELCRCDDSSLELVLSGVWVAANGETHSGRFVTALSPSVEQRLAQLWLSAQAHALQR